MTPPPFLAAIITIGSEVTRACTTETAGAAVGAKAFAHLHQRANKV